MKTVFCVLLVSFLFIITANTFAQTEDKYESPYLPLLAVSAALAYQSYDYFKTASDITGDDEDSKAVKTRYIVGGVIFGAATIINTIFALKKVKVIGTDNSIGLSYNF
jgi:hypothetical protein